MKDEEFYETKVEGDTTEKDLEEFAEFEQKLQDLFQEYGFGTGCYYLMKPIKVENLLTRLSELEVIP